MSREILFGGRTIRFQDLTEYEVITLTLQGLPPSTNSIWRAVDGKVLKSAEYRSWVKATSWEFRTQAGIRKMRGAYEMTVRFARTDKRRRDLDNLLKSLGDSIVAAGIVKDDSLCQRIDAAWHAEPITKITLTSSEASA